MGGVTSPTTNFICTLASVGTFQTRHGTFQTQEVVQSKKDLPSLFPDGGEAASDSGDDTGDIGIMDYGFEHRGHWDWDYDYGHWGHWDWDLDYHRDSAYCLRLFCRGQIHGRVG